MILKTITGNINLSKTSASLFLRNCPAVDGVGRQERLIYEAAQDADTSHLIKKVGFGNHAPSIAGVLKEIGGRMVTQEYDLPQGAIIKVQVTRKLGHGKMPKSGLIFIRMREGAAYRKLTIPMLDSPKTHFKEAYLEGSFDILTLEQAEDWGVKMTRATRIMGDSFHSSLVYTEDAILHQPQSVGTQAKSKEVTGKDGEKKRVVTRKRRRSIG